MKSRVATQVLEAGFMFLCETFALCTIIVNMEHRLLQVKHSAFCIHVHYFEVQVELYLELHDDCYDQCQ